MPEHRSPAASPANRRRLAAILLAPLLALGAVAAAPAQRSAETGAAALAPEPSVAAFLLAFERASVGNDADRKAELYAPEIDRYFLRTHVTRQFVAHDLLTWLSSGRLITRFHITVLSATGVGSERTLLIRKEAAWINGSEHRSLSTRSQLILRRFGGEWKIVSERDYKPTA